MQGRVERKGIEVTANKERKYSAQDFQVVPERTSTMKKSGVTQKDKKSKSLPAGDDKARRSDTVSPKSDGKQGFMNTFRKKVSELRGSLRLAREQNVACKKDGQATEKQKKADIEKVITERMKNWGRLHNLPEWAQERIAKSVVQEDERRKRRAELEAKKFQILKKATLRHAIVIGDKAAAEEKVKLQAKEVMKDMRKGDAALPYSLKTLNLENLVEQSASQASSASSTENASKEAAGNVAVATPAPPTAADQKAKSSKSAPEKPSQVEQEVATQMFAAIFAGVGNLDWKLLVMRYRKLFQQSQASQSVSSPHVSTDLPTAPTPSSGDIDPSLQEYINRLCKKDLWENESNENALYNWIISQSSPDDARNKLPKKAGPKVEFEKTVTGRTFPRGRTYSKDEPSVEFKNNLIGYR